jgi:hypothetical protein
VKRTPLKRKTGLQRSRVRLGRRGDSSRQALIGDAYAFVARRAAGRCEIDADRDGVRVCNGRHEHTHHTRGRVGADAYNATLMLATCRPCHDYVHAHPKASYSWGWLKRRTGLR